METIKKIFDSFDRRGMVELNKFMEVKFYYYYNKKKWDWEGGVTYDEISGYNSIEDAPSRMTTTEEEEYSCYFVYENEGTIVEKILCWLSRPASKEGVEGSRLWLLDGINKFLGTSFNTLDIELIYTYLGNGCNKELREKFIESEFDMEIIRNHEK